MTHPTKAGERERKRLALFLDDEAECRERSAEGHVGGQRNREMADARDFRRAANLLRTEPGGEALIDRVEARCQEELVYSYRRAAEITLEEASRPTTPVEPDLLHALREAEAGLEFAISTIKGKAPEVDWEDSSPRKALRTVKKALSSAPVEEREP